MFDQFKKLLKHQFFTNREKFVTYSLCESEERQIELVKQLGFEPLFTSDELNNAHCEAPCWFYNDEKNLLLVVKYGSINIHHVKTFEDLSRLILLCPKGVDLRVFIDSDDIMGELTKVVETIVKRVPKDNLESITHKFYKESDTIVIDIVFVGEKNFKETVKISCFKEVKISCFKETDKKHHSEKEDRFEYATFNSDQFGVRSNIEMNLNLFTVLNRLYYLEERLSDINRPF